MVQVNRWMDNGMLSRSISLEIRDAKPNTCLSHSFSKNHACGFPVLLGFQARNAQDLSGANSMYFSGHCSVKLPWLCGSISFGVIFFNLFRRCTDTRGKPKLMIDEPTSIGMVSRPNGNNMNKPVPSTRCNWQQLTHTGADFLKSYLTRAVRRICHVSSATWPKQGAHASSEGRHLKYGKTYTSCSPPATCCGDSTESTEYINF
jgi:hypothetical protein